MTTLPRKKTFDAVAESRKWRLAAGRQLARMSAAERIAFLNQGLDAAHVSPRPAKKK